MSRLSRLNPRATVADLGSAANPITNPAAPRPNLPVVWWATATTPTNIGPNDFRVKSNPNKGVYFSPLTSLSVVVAGAQSLSLGADPIPNSETVFRVRSSAMKLLVPTTDYTLSGRTLTILASNAGDVFYVKYSYVDQAAPTDVWTSQVVYSDSFNRANSTSSLGIADTGQSYVVPLNRLGQQPVAGIIGNQAYFSASNTDNYAWPDLSATPVSDCTFEFDIAVASGSVGPYVRAVDSSNGYTSDLTTFYKRVAGTNTGLITYANPFASGDRVRVVMLGPSIKIYRRVGGVGSWVLNGNVSDSTFQTATNHGWHVGSGVPTTARLDGTLLTVP